MDDVEHEAGEPDPAVPDAQHLIEDAIRRLSMLGDGVVPLEVTAALSSAHESLTDSVRSECRRARPFAEIIQVGDGQGIHYGGRLAAGARPVLRVLRG